MPRALCLSNHAGLNPCLFVVVALTPLSHHHQPVSLTGDLLQSHELSSCRLLIYDMPWGVDQPNRHASIAAQCRQVSLAINKANICYYMR